MSPLQQLLHLKPSSSKFHDKFNNIICGEEYKQWVQRIGDRDAGVLVDHLDKLLDAIDPTAPSFRRCLRELRRICGANTTLPTSYALSSQDLFVGPRPAASGGSGDIYEGQLDGSKVCVKRLRVYLVDGPGRATKALYQEAIVWKHLKHKNIVPLLGITTSPLQLVSEWIPGGDLREHIEKHPDANRLGLLHDVARGLRYLHSRNVVHGDLKGPNILVGKDGRARITDFGLATITQNADSIRSASDGHGHTARWTAPEILNEEGTYSKEADIFSFAMVTIEIFTGAVPFHASSSPAAMVAIMKGMRPPRPMHPKFTDRLWVLTKRCWDQDPHLRPEVSNVLDDINSPPPNPYINRIGSSPALTIGQKSLLATLPQTVAKQPSSLYTTISAASRSTPQLSSQPSDFSTPITPVSHEETPLHWSSQATLHAPSPGVDHYRSTERPQGPPSRNVGRRPPRKNTATSEPSSPLLEDPYPYNLDELRKGKGRLYDGDTNRVGKPRIDRNRSQKDLSDRVDQTHPHYLNNSSSHFDLTSTGARDLSRQPSGKLRSKANGHATGITSRPDWTTESKHSNRSWVDVGEIMEANGDHRGLPAVDNSGSKKHGILCFLKKALRTVKKPR